MLSRAQLYKIIAEQQVIIADLRAIFDKQNEKIITLEARIKELEQTKNSSNSSIPPSRDENRILTNQSLRKKTDRKVGGQPGHEGHTLKMVDNPTQIVSLKPQNCSKCGENLALEPVILMEKRQVYDIPPSTPIITEYQKFKIVCQCGQCNQGTFPAHVTSPTQYGNSVQNLVVYLNVRQYMPFNRIREHFLSLYQLPISEGTIQNMLKSMAQKMMPAYEIIKQKIEKAKVVGGDETSVRINGKKHWFWTIQNTILTYIVCTNNRAFATLEALFPNGLPNTIVCHDAYSAWFKLACRKHQLCMAHLLRDLKYFEDYEPCKWVEQTKLLIYKAIKWKESKTEIPHTFREQLLKIQENPPDNPSKKLNAFVNRLKKYEKSLFNFLDHKNVPSDNNGSERAIRNVKVKSKISGQFKSIENANIFAVLRSVIDTLIKNNRPIFENLDNIARFRAE